jgi:hypothetical protein
MKRLRHPVRAIREPFGTAGLAVACIALIAALGGTALAAKGALTGKQKKEVEKIAKKFAGKPGAPGAAGSEGKQGPAGAAGKDGTNGSNGTNGKDGTNGTNGTDGVDGESPVGTHFAGNAEPTGNPCEGAGGVEYEIQSTEEVSIVCNGEEGSPWTAGGTLPPGAMETGAFSVQGSNETEAEVELGLFSTVSFSIPLASPLDAEHVKLAGGFPFPEACKTFKLDGEGHFINGTVNEPFARPGYLCVYFGPEQGGTFLERIEPLDSFFVDNVAGAGTSGARLRFEPPSEAFAFANGAFAVTAPLPAP